jgi:hypothetical protein
MSEFHDRSAKRKRLYCSPKCATTAQIGSVRSLDPRYKKRLYKIWDGMKQRCLNPRAKDYSHYGGRGIQIIPAWIADFAAFEAWALSHGYADTLLLERSENNGPYSPDNCEWATSEKQARNRRGNTVLTAFGETKTAKEWSQDSRCAVSYPALIARITRQGLPVETALTYPAQPFGSRKRIPHN